MPEGVGINWPGSANPHLDPTVPTSTLWGVVGLGNDKCSARTRAYAHLQLSCWPVIYVGRVVRDVYSAVRLDCELLATSKHLCIVGPYA